MQRFARGVTVLELLVAMTIVGLLVGVLLPAVHAAREASRRVQCVSNMREIGLALQICHNASGSLPMGWEFDPTSQTAYGWGAALRPYLAQPGLHSQIDKRLPLGDASLRAARETSLDIMLCPSDIAERSFTLYLADEASHDDAHALRADEPTESGSDELVPLIELPTANYVGVFGTLEPDDSIPAPLGDGAFLENRATSFRDFERGTSHTMVVGERTMAQVPSTWLGVDLQGEDAAARLVGAALEGINQRHADECDFSSRHVGGANFLWGDGHVRFITENIDLDEYHRSAKLRHE